MSEKRFIRIKTFLYPGVVFTLIDMIFFACYWLIGNGYVNFEPATHEYVVSIIGEAWDVLHTPINGIFGSLFFPNFEPYGWSPSFIAYLILCFLQMFLVGALLGIFKDKFWNRV